MNMNSSWLILTGRLHRDVSGFKIRYRMYRMLARTSRLRSAWLALL